MIRKSIFIFGFMLICSTEFIARAYAPAIRSFADSTILYKKSLLEGKQQLDFDGIFIGDSRILGVDAKLISNMVLKEQNKNYEFYNFSLPDHGVRGYYLFLKKYLERHKRPEFVFFATAPIGLTGKWNIVKNDKSMSAQLHRFCLLFSVKDYYEVFPFKFFIRATLAKIERISFFIAYRRMIRDFLENFDSARMNKPTLEQVTWNRNGGVNFGTGEPPSEEQVKSVAYYQMKFEVDKDTLYWYKKFFSLAEDQEIKVIIFNAPLMDVIYDKRQGDGTNQQYEKMIRIWQSEFKNISVMEPLLEPYDRKYFKDAQHLNGRGFQVFNHWLGEKFIQLLL